MSKLLVNSNSHTMNGDFLDRNLDQYRSTRTVLHERRSEINKKINHDLLIKRGASNLIDVAKDKKAREKAIKEINLVNINLQDLKNELDHINCSFAEYQQNTQQLPMIPIGMKDCEPVDLRPLMTRFLEEHYYASPEPFNSAIEYVQKLREMLRRPKRDEQGVQDFKNYYSMLTVIDHRFFHKDVRRNFWFTWNDSFTGVAFKQVSLAFEKGSVLFNLGALYSHIATAYPRDTPESLRQSATAYLESARIFRMLRENFSYAPSPDMSNAMLVLVIRILMLQKQECEFLEFGMNPKKESENYQRLGEFIGLAIALSQSYESVTHTSYSSEFEILPASWGGLFEIKAKFYKAQAYYRFAAALLGLVMHEVDQNEAENTPENLARLQAIDRQIENELDIWMRELHHVVRFTQPLNVEEATAARNKRSFGSVSKKSSLSKAKGPKRSQSTLGTWRKSSQPPVADPVSMEEVPTFVPKNRYDACQVGIACLKEAILHIEDILRVIRLNQELKSQEPLTNYVTKVLDDWKFQRQHLIPTVVALQQRFAPNEALDESYMNGNGDASSAGGTVRGRSSKKLKKSTSSASQYAKNGSEPGVSTKHVAPRLLPFAMKELSELPVRIVFTRDFPMVDDPFQDLGPLEMFNAKTNWTKPVTIRLKRGPGQGYGFCIKGNSPIVIVKCDQDTPADRGGLRAGDVIVALNGQQAVWMSHDAAVQLVNEGLPVPPSSHKDTDQVELTVVRCSPSMNALSSLSLQQ